MKMKVTYFLGLFVCLGQTLSAQQGLVSSGGDLASTTGSVAYSIGQVAYATIEAESGNVNPGLQQPFEFSIVAVSDLNGDYVFKLYPNPANQFLYLQLSNEEGLIQGYDFMVKVYDVKGNLLFNQRLADAVNTIRISGLPEALYFIQIWQANTLIQSISFTKTN